jgi:hypothetical protein
MQRVVRVLASLAMAIAGLAVHPGNVAAICVWLDPIPTAFDVASTPVVFVGTVASTTDTDRTGYLTVDEIWRGPDLPRVTTLYGGDPQVIFEDDGHWTLGIRYLVFASAEPGGKLVAGGCGPTQAYQSSFDALRPADARLHYADARLQYGTLLGGAVIVLAGAVVFVVWRARRRRVGRSQP